MPGFDRTGPMGAGPLTGGGFGYCGKARGAGARTQLEPGRPFGRGRGAGRGFGRGAGRCFGWWGYGYARPYDQPPGPASEKALLTDQAAQLRSELAALEGRLADLEKETQESS
jgi:hypothetical protein